MRPISTEGFEKPKSVSDGAAPMLQWLKITDLVVDPAYQRPIVGKGRQNVDRIARAFSWSCFAPVVVSPRRVRQVLYHRQPAPHHYGYYYDALIARRHAVSATHDAEIAKIERARRDLDQALGGGGGSGSGRSTLTSASMRAPPFGN
jgi:hypothetical protein